MKARGIIVHLYRGGWSVYRVQGAGAVSDFLQDGSPVPEGVPGGVLLMVKEGEVWPVRVETPPKLKGGERRRVSTKRKALVGPFTKSKASKP